MSSFALPANLSIHPPFARLFRFGCGFDVSEQIPGYERESAGD